MTVGVCCIILIKVLDTLSVKKIHFVSYINAVVCDMQYLYTVWYRPFISGHEASNFIFAFYHLDM